MYLTIFIFVSSLILAVKGATLATTYSGKLAQSFNLPRYTVGFIVVAFISLLPETLISISSALQGIPEFGLATLFGSNIADLTLIFAILVLTAGRGIKIESKILKNVYLYPYFILMPVVFGINGYYSRLEGIFLIIAGVAFYYFLLKNSAEAISENVSKENRYKSLFYLTIAVLFLLAGSHFLVTSAVDLAHAVNVTPVLIGMLVVSLGTTLPELLFSYKAVQRREDGLAIGDILGSVLADATIIVGILAVISPFYFPAKIVYVTGIFMIVSSIILLKFMKTGRVLTKKEGYLLMSFWLVYVVVELILSKTL